MENSLLPSPSQLPLAYSRSVISPLSPLILKQPHFLQSFCFLYFCSFFVDFLWRFCNYFLLLLAGRASQMRHGTAEYESDQLKLLREKRKKKGDNFAQYLSFILCCRIKRWSFFSLLQNFIPISTVPNSTWHLHHLTVYISALTVLLQSTSHILI